MPHPLSSLFEISEENIALVLSRRLLNYEHYLIEDTTDGNLEAYEVNMKHPGCYPNWNRWI